jgi:FlaG/FlaF family flagellin (archaellin)
MYLSEELQKKWDAVLNHPDLPQIADPYRKAVTAVVLENQATEMQKSGQILQEAAPTNSLGGTGYSGGSAAGGPVAGFDPILISLVRRSLPNLIAYDVCGVQPMTGPTGLIFAMRSTYSTQNVTAGATEAFYNEANTFFSGTNDGSQTDITLAANTETGSGNTFSSVAPGTAMPTATAEALGDGAGPDFNEMAFSIEKVTVTAKTRALKAEYSMELAQDLKAVHGLDAETELANILSSEILAEINREVVRTIYKVAKVGAQVGTTTRGTFNLDTDSNGRWMVEKIKGLAFQIEREANTIAKTTRRGKGNILICSSDVASAFAMAGILDYQSALAGQVSLTVDDTGNTYAGTMFGRIKVYIDPYFPAGATSEFAVVGYKGSNAYDAGMFYCPYVPLQMVRAVDTGTFQPKIGFKTRYGLVANPFAEGTAQGLGALNAMSNVYYRGFKIANLM